MCSKMQKASRVPLSKHTHAFSGSINQSLSHSHPLGGMKYSCFSFSLPVTSENLWRPTSPVVPHFPKTWAWFSYCETVKGEVFGLRCWLETAVLNFAKIVSDDIPSQQRHWRFPQRRSWISSRMQTDPATCWLWAELAPSASWCPSDTEWAER